MEQIEQVVADILIVEDEVAHAEAIEEGLTRLGHRCVVVNDGKAAVAAIQSRPFDIIVTDLVLGGEIDGLGVLDAAVRTAPAAKVILITARPASDHPGAPPAA